MTHCPACQTPLHASAIVTAFNDPPGWDFWGNEGVRFIRCQGEGFKHFYVIVSGKENHRVARFKK